MPSVRRSRGRTGRGRRQRVAVPDQRVRCSSPQSAPRRGSRQPGKKINLRNVGIWLAAGGWRVAGWLAAGGRCSISFLTCSARPSFSAILSVAPVAADAVIIIIIIIISRAGPERGRAGGITTAVAGPIHTARALADGRGSTRPSSPRVPAACPVRHRCRWTDIGGTRRADIAGTSANAGQTPPACSNPVHLPPAWRSKH